MSKNKYLKFKLKKEKMLNIKLNGEFFQILPAVDVLREGFW